MHCLKIRWYTAFLNALELNIQGKMLEKILQRSRGTFSPFL